MEAPPGGPVDTKRPYVTAVLPGPDSVRVGPVLDAQIKFSEWVAPDAERGKVYLVPPLTRKIRARLSGDELRVTSAGRLDTNTTYILGVLGTIKDINGQPLEGPLQLAFSTGPVLDSGRLAGTLVPFQGKPGLGAFAALYPRGPELRARFQHLTHRNDSVVVPSAQPDPLKEKPVYIAPTDSLGRFDFKRLRPGRYGLIGFQDINGDLTLNAGSEALAIGPSVDIAAAPGEAQTLALAPYDTVPLRLVSARWAAERSQGGKSLGTVRLKFNRPPHPTQGLRREAYVVRRLGPKGSLTGGASIPVADVCVNPTSGEVEIATAPLDPDSQYVAACPGVRDGFLNPVDSARSLAVFKADTARDTAKAEFTLLGARRVSGESPKMPLDVFFPRQGLRVYYPRLLLDSTLGWLRANLRIKLDTVPVTWTLQRISQHEFSLSFPGDTPLKGQRLSIAILADSTARAAAAAVPKPSAPAPSSPKDSLAKTVPVSPIVVPPPTVPIATLTLADAAKLGSLKFKQDKSAFGSRLVLRGIAMPWEFTRITPAAEEVVVDSLPEGFYAVDYFRDTNGDGVWHSGSLAPWAIAEPYAEWADSVEVKAGGVNRGDGRRPGAARTAVSADSSKTVGSSASGERRLAWPPLW